MGGLHLTRIIFTNVFHHFFCWGKFVNKYLTLRTLSIVPVLHNTKTAQIAIVLIKPNSLLVRTQLTLIS